MKLRKIAKDGDPKNKEKAYKFFTEQKGYSPEAALGIVGNLMQESHSNLVTSALGFDGTGSYGIAQWLGPRKKKLMEVRPDDYHTLEGQLEFIDWELNNTERRAASKLKEATTVEDAALSFSKYYERPHKDYAHNDKRVKYATDLHEQLGITRSVRPELKQEFEKNNEKEVERLKQVPTDNTAVSSKGATYAALPDLEEPAEVESEKMMSQSEVAKLLEQQNNRPTILPLQQEEEIVYEPQAREQDLSHLYGYINIED